MTPERRKIGPGVYEVGDEMHVDAREFCEELGYPPTRENQEVAARAAAEMAAEEGIAVEYRENG